MLVETYTTAWRPWTHQTHDPDTSFRIVLLIFAYELLYISICGIILLWSTKIESSLSAVTSKQIQTVAVLFQTFVVAIVHSSMCLGQLTSLWEFFTHFFGLILQSLLKPVCFAHLIGNCAFILSASQFKRGLRQAVT